jgi:hypothetical protein
MVYERVVDPEHTVTGQRFAFSFSRSSVMHVRNLLTVSVTRIFVEFCLPPQRD